MWKPEPHQLELSTIGFKILKEHGIVYYAMEERTGKTVTAMLTCEESPLVSNVLVVTKVKAMDGWNEAINNLQHLCSYTLTSYHSAHKVKGKFDAIILDEAHSYISGYPKRSVLWQGVAKHTKYKPIIYCSATPYAQGPQLLFNQFALSSYSPWEEHKDFYAWFKKYAKRDKAGQFKVIYIGPDRTAIDYKAVDEEKILADVNHLFVTRTRKELGFEYEPEDKLHYIQLTQHIKDVYNTLLVDNTIDFIHSGSGKHYSLVCDSQIKLRWALHMLEGGVLKIDDESVDLGNSEKVDYIKQVWGDTEEIVIMYQYKADLVKLGKQFKKARLLQAQSYAEGVDLSMYKHLIIYSQDFSTSKHTQRRARQANMKRKEEIVVHYLLVKNAVSEQVYKTVSKNKKNFVDSVFERTKL